MYFIVNKTKSIVSLGDIKITLGPRQATDLDKIMSREQIEKSRHLKGAISNRMIELRVKDGKKKKKSTPKPVEVPVNNDMNEMRQMMEDLKGAVSQLAQPTSSPTVDVDEIVRKVVENIPASKETTIIHEGQQKRKDEEVEMDEETVAKLNARTVDKIVKDTKVKSIKYKEDAQKDTILDNVNELEDLFN